MGAKNPFICSLCHYKKLYPIYKIKKESSFSQRLINLFNLKKCIFPAVSKLILKSFKYPIGIYMKKSCEKITPPPSFFRMLLTEFQG